MKIDVKRFEYSENYTIGKLFIDDEFQCLTLEDKVREVKGQPVEQWKVYGKTAIPCGTYQCKMTFSNRFQRELPQILDVPGFEGIRIHNGNTSANTSGCLLLGTTWTGGDQIGQSKAALEAFLLKFPPSESVTLKIGDSVEDFS